MSDSTNESGCILQTDETVMEMWKFSPESPASPAWTKHYPKTRFANLVARQVTVEMPALVAREAVGFAEEGWG